MPLMKTYMFFFSRMECFPDYTFKQAKKIKNKSPLSIEEKNFACAIFGKIYVARAINRCLHERDRAVPLTSLHKDVNFKNIHHNIMFSAEFVTVFSYLCSLTFYYSVPVGL